MDFIKPELLVPAGNLEKLKIAVHYGADAIYVGGEKYSLRAWAKNFTFSELEEGISYARDHGVKVYFALNALCHNADIDEIVSYIEEIDRLSPDAIIACDPGVIALIKETASTLDIHLSTQSNATNWKTCEFWQNQGISRICLARELSSFEILQVRRKVPQLELEVFVHGALCISYSGRCFISKYVSMRDANSGDCSQPCRWKYYLMEEHRPKEYFPVREDEKGTYLYNSKDLCLINHIPQLVRSGVHSFKIEGRMKSISYLAVVTSIYREAIDRFIKSPDRFTNDTKWLIELEKVSTRGYTTGFFEKKPSVNDQHLMSSRINTGFDFLGIVQEVLPDETVKVDIRNKIHAGENVESFDKKKGCLKNRVEEIIDMKSGVEKKWAQPNEVVILRMSNRLEKYNLIRRQKM